MLDHQLHKKKKDLKGRAIHVALDLQLCIPAHHRLYVSKSGVYRLRFCGTKVSREHIAAL